MHPRTRLVYFYFLRVERLLKTWSQSRRHIVQLPWQRYICPSKFGCFCISPKVTYLHTKIEERLKFFISNFASLSWRIALNGFSFSCIDTRIAPCKKQLMYKHIKALAVQCSFELQVSQNKALLNQFLVSLLKFCPVRG